MTTTHDVLDRLARHLNTFALPGSASLTVADRCDGGQLAVQLLSRDLPTIAADLLAWADTLTAPAGEAWRVPRGDSVHLAIRGELAPDVTADVYGALPYSAALFGPGLEPGGRQSVGLIVLREWACLDTREAA